MAAVRQFFFLLIRTLYIEMHEVMHRGVGSGPEAPGKMSLRRGGFNLGGDVETSPGSVVSDGSALRSARPEIRVSHSRTTTRPRVGVHILRSCEEKLDTGSSLYEITFETMYHEDKGSELKPISTMMDLFGRSVPVSKTGKVLSERQELVRYFVERAQDRKGPLSPGRVGFMLSHCSKEDLYAFKSILESETARPWPQDAGKDPGYSVRWNRIFWARLRNESDTPKA